MTELSSSGMRFALSVGALLMACAAPNGDVAAPPCDFRDARGPFAEGHLPATAEPPDVQFEPDRDVIMKGQVPQVNVRVGDHGIGRFNKTTAFELMKPDKTPSKGPCVPSRAPTASGGFAALSFECHPLDQAGVYAVKFDPVSVGLEGEKAELALRVVDALLPVRATQRGWKATSMIGQPPASRCWNARGYKAGLVGGRVTLQVTDEARVPARVPAALAPRLSAEHAKRITHVFEADDGWIVMFDHGEFGGGVEWFSRSGGAPRSVFIGRNEMYGGDVQNVNRAEAAGGAIYVLQGLSHMGMSEGQLARLWREHDHFTSHVIARFASEPFEWIRIEDGSWLIATWNAIWHTSERGESTLVARLPDVAWYPNSFVREGDGTLYVGMRGGVLRLTPTWPDMPRYAVDLLVPENDADLSCWQRADPEG